MTTRRLFVAMLVSLALHAPAHGQTITWTGTINNSWHTAGNWDLNRVPTAGDAVVIPDVTGTPTITFNTGTTTIDSLTSAEALTLSGGTLNVQVSGAFNAALTLNGATLSGSGALTANDLMTWSSGTLTGATPARTVTISSSGALNMTVSTKTLGCVLNNQGTATWSAGQVNSTGGTFNNQNLFSCTAAAIWFGISGTNAFNNNGTFIRSGAGTSTFQTSGTAVPFNNQLGGTVSVTGGTLQTLAGGSHAGDFSVDPGALLELSGNHIFAAGADITGNGNLKVSGGTSTYAGSLNTTGTVTFQSGSFAIAGTTTAGTLEISGGTGTLNWDVTVTTITVSSGTLTGSGNRTFSGVTTWSGGTITGTTPGVVTTISSSGTLNMTVSTKTLGCVLNNQGTATWSAGQVNSTGGTFNNQNLFSCTAAAIWFGISGTNAFNNNGTFIRSGAGTSTFQTSGTAVPFTNTGTIDVQSGTLAMPSGLTNFSGTTLTGGTYLIAGTLQFQGANIVTNAATVVLDGATSAIVNQSNANGLANFATNAAAGSFTIRNGRGYARTGGFSNAGAVRIGPGASTFSATGNYTQFGGTTTLAGGTLDPTNLVDIQAGELRGNGNILANVTNAGACKVGLSPGSIFITGDYTQTPGGLFEAEIGGAAPGVGGFDQLVVSGVASLSGELNVLLFGGFQPAVGTTFDILTAGSVSGTFATENLPVPFLDNCKAGPEYGPTHVRITTYAQVMITAQPASADVCLGAPASFDVVAAGSGPFMYQWRKNRVDIGGATSATYMIPAVSLPDEADYDCIITNICGSENSAVAALNVFQPPQITQQPDAATRCEGASVTFTAVSIGEPTPTFQWRKDGIDILGATGPSHTIASASANDTGSYDCVATNICGVVTTTAASLIVNTTPVVSLDPQSQTVCAGDVVSFAITATGTPAPTLQWRKDGSNLPGANSSTYSIMSAVPADAGIYDCVVSNECGTDTSAAAILAVNEAPLITNQPSAATRCEGTSVTFTITATNVLTPSYLWRIDGVAIPGASSASHTVASVSFSDAGNYDCVVSNACGAETSAVATLTVNSAPQITQDPFAQTVARGSTVLLTATAGGAGPLSFQWFRDGLPISLGTTPCGAGLSTSQTPPGPSVTNTLTISNLTWSQSGSYYVEVAGACGLAASNAADVTVDCFADINGNRAVDLADLSSLLGSFGSCAGAPAYNHFADLNCDGCIDLTDLSMLLSAFGTMC